MIEIHADEGPDQTMILTTEKDGRLVDVEVVVDGDGVFISFRFVTNPTAKAEPVLRNFVPS